MLIHSLHGRFEGALTEAMLIDLAKSRSTTFGKTSAKTCQCRLQSMNCFFSGKITGNPLFQWKVQWLPVDFPFNQPIDKKY